MWNFQILIVSAVKICKQCLQTASASSPRLPTGASPFYPLGLGSVIFVNENENENGEKRENNELVNEN